MRAVRLSGLSAVGFSNKIHIFHDATVGFDTIFVLVLRPQKEDPRQWRYVVQCEMKQHILGNLSLPVLILEGEQSDSKEGCSVVQKAARPFFGSMKKIHMP